MTTDAWAVCHQGLRWKMEDTHALLTEGDALAGAVFDGHNGVYVAALAAATFSQYGDVAPGAALRAIHDRARGLPGGACGVAFRLRGERLEVANVGDAALVRVTGETAEVLTENHRLDNPAERARVLAAGAIIEGPYVVDPRTFTGLMPTRSLGDHGFERVGIVCEPHEWVGSFPSGWLVAASDGLWDLMAPDELPGHLARAASARAAAEALAQEALEVRGCADNLTVIVVRRTPQCAGGLLPRAARPEPA